jgi:hypothetical protein
MNATEINRKDSEINEANRYSAIHNGLVAGSCIGRSSIFLTWLQVEQDSAPDIIV